MQKNTLQCDLCEDIPVVGSNFCVHCHNTLFRLKLKVMQAEYTDWPGFHGSPPRRHDLMQSTPMGERYA